MDELAGDGAGLLWVAVKAGLLYLTAVIGLRLTKRRTLAEMAPYDFVTAVAVGAIVGRVPNAEATSYLAGAITLVTLLVLHRAITALRRLGPIAPAVDPPPRLLVHEGVVLADELRRSGLTHKDLEALLRQHGVDDWSELRFAILEERGQLSVVRSHPDAPDGDAVPELVRPVTAGRGPLVGTDGVRARGRVRR